jgi:hypothetical protein
MYNKVKNRRTDKWRRFFFVSFMVVSTKLE